MDIEHNIQEIRKRIERAADRAGRSPSEGTIVAITKTVNPSAIEQAFRAGIRHFGESQVQEARDKLPQLSHLEPRPTWHMVGHLQTNKVRTTVEIFDIIHSVDSLRLAELLNRLAPRRLPVLLEVNASGEAAKYGFPVAEVARVVEQVSRSPNLDLQGLMTVAPMVADPEEVRPVFRKLRELRDALGLRHLSMGMTDDFEVAVEEGATLVRLGRAIFGERPGI